MYEDTTVLMAGAVAVLLVVGLSVASVKYQLHWRVLAAGRRLGASIKYRLKRRVVSLLMGGKHPNASRLLLIVVVVSGLGAGLGLLGLLVSHSQKSASSAPVVITFFDLATNPWVWVLITALLFRSLLFFGDRLLAQITAAVTGYSYNTVRRLAEEAKKPDFNVCESVLVQSGDSNEEIQSWVNAAFDGELDFDVSFVAPGDDADEGADTDAADDALVPHRRPLNTAPDETAGPIDVDAVDEDDSDEMDFWAQLRLFRLEVASAMDLSSVLWRFVTPALITFVGILLWAGIWVQVWVYPALIALATFVGAGYYWVVDLRHRRRLQSFRDEDEPSYWTDLVIHVKTVEVPETTMYYGFVDGNVYASEDCDALAETLATRALDRLNGQRPAPAVEEKHAYLLKRYLPMLEAWREEREKPAIMDQLVNTVADAPEGMLPRDLLVEEVVEYDRRYAAWGLIPLGYGRDPDLVREVYADLVESHALVETPVTLTDPDGEEYDIVAVSLGDEPLPPNVAQLRSEFSAVFGKRAEETRYEAPNVNLNVQPAPFVPPGTGAETTD